MTKYKVITLPLAEEDIADQTDYIAFELRSPETAANTVKGFQKVINSLSLFPQSHELALVFSSIANIGFTFLESALYFRW